MRSLAPRQQKTVLINTYAFYMILIVIIGLITGLIIQGVTIYQFIQGGI